MLDLYIVKRGILGRWEDGASVKYRTGDFILLDEESAKALGDRVELSEVKPDVEVTTTPAAQEPLESVSESDQVVEDIIEIAEEAIAMVEEDAAIIEEAAAIIEEAADVIEEVSDTTQFEYLNDLHWTAARDVIRSLESRADVLAAKAVEMSRPKPRNAVLTAIESKLRD